MLSNGEYVVNAKSVNKVGVPFLNAINGMKDGGPVYQGRGSVTDAKAVNNAINKSGGLLNYTANMLKGFGKTALLTYGPGKALKIMKGLKSLTKLPGVQALSQSSQMIHRSQNPITRALPQQQVAMTYGRAYGPGTYFAESELAARQLFRHHGDYLYKMNMSPIAKLKVLRSKGYINKKQFDAMEVELRNAGLGGRRLSDATSVDDPLVQYLLKKGYIGNNPGLSMTNWLVGNKGFGLKLMESPVGKGFADGGYISSSMMKSLPKFETGIKNVPHDMAAILHQGERVLTKEENKNYPTSNLTISPTFNITGGNSKEIVDQVMVKLNILANKNNKSNRVMI